MRASISLYNPFPFPRYDLLRPILPLHWSAALFTARRRSCPYRFVRHQLHCWRIADVLSAVLSGRLGLVDLVGNDNVAIGE